MYRRAATRLAVITTVFVALSIAFTFLVNAYAPNPGVLLVFRLVQVVALVAFAVFFFRRVMGISNALRQSSTRTDSLDETK